jgi:hypothetical protein
LKQQNIFRPAHGANRFKFSRTGTTVYLDEGNGVFLADKASANELQRDR